MRLIKLMKNSTRRRIKHLNYMKNRQEKIIRLLMWKDNKQKKNNYDAKVVLKFLKENKFNVESVSSRHKVITIPKVFSFIKNPDETILTLKKILTYGLDKKTREIFIDHSKCDDLDICASTIMDVIVMAIKDKRNKKSNKLRLHGIIGKNNKIREILLVSGLLYHLDLSPIGDDKLKNIEKLSLMVKGNSDLIGTRVGEYFLKCLKTQGFSLTKKGMKMIGLMVGEVIDNCDAHSGDLKEWYTLGHYSKESDEACGECRLVIFDFGDTIYESFSKHGSKIEMKEIVDEVAATNRSILFNAQSKESRATLLALQDGVSRFKEIDNDRGTGTIKLIESFQSIGKDRNSNTPLMSITSGKTQILFDGKYQLKKEIINGKEKQIIAFNEENDLNKPPNINNVKDLKEFFPGTIISMKFFLDKDYLTQCVQGERK